MVKKNNIYHLIYTTGLCDFNERMDRIEWGLFIIAFVLSVICCIFAGPGALLAWASAALWILRTMIEKIRSKSLQNEIDRQREMYEEILVDEVKNRQNLEKELQKIKKQITLKSTDEEK